MTGVRAAVLAWPANPMYHHCHDRLLQRPTSLALCLALPLVRGCRPGLFGRAASLFCFSKSFWGTARVHCLAGVVGVSGLCGGLGALLVAVAMAGVTHHGGCQLFSLLAAWVLPLSGWLL